MHVTRQKLKRCVAEGEEEYEEEKMVEQVRREREEGLREKDEAARRTSGE